MKNFPSEDLPGDYGEFAELVVEETGAEAVVVMVLGGNRGNGATPLMKLNGTLPLAELRSLVCAALRAMADGIEGLPLPVPVETTINSRTPRGEAN